MVTWQPRDKDQAGMQEGHRKGTADLPTGRTWPDPGGSRQQRASKVGSLGSGRQGRWSWAGGREVGVQAERGLGFREEGSPEGG